MTERIKAYTYRGRHRLRVPLGAVLLALLDNRTKKTRVAAWRWLEEFWAQAGLGVSLVALVVMLIQSSNSMVHHSTVIVPSTPVVATVDGHFPVETTSAVNT